MIILDTNVISEAIRPSPDPHVQAWLKMMPREALFTTVISRAELLYGVALLPNGRRKSDMKEAVLRILDSGLKGHIIDFDSRCADIFAGIAAQRRQQGMPISQADAMIAAIAIARKATLATRNTKDFQGCGVELINPWEGVQTI
ncbi:MAG: type II toxin-antitoxin system VapC family toxin [Lautropia sp.]|nr:type II toxin-antitoxin system VapC family toxin [Lautropia sp.]